MKRYNIILLLFLSVMSFAQTQPPLGIQYQGIANNGGGIYSGQMGIRISILSGSATGTLEYSETHFPISGSNGYYSIIIGQPSGTSGLGAGVVSGNFSLINWGAGDKFLKVELSFTGPSYTSYQSSNTTQLWSVPYALHAKSVPAIPSFTVRNNIADLRANPGTAANEIVTIKGYNVPGDGGGGKFMWITDSNFRNGGKFMTDNGGIILQCGTNDDGRWVRQYDGFINVAYFGALGTWGNYTAQIQNAIDFAELVLEDNGPSFFISNTVYIPSGNYVIDKITLKDGVSILGDNLQYTNIFPSNSADPYMVDMEIGRVRINVANLCFVGAYQGSPFLGNSTKGVFFLQALNENRLGQYSWGWTDGMMTSSSFKNIQIRNFKGTGIHLKDGYLVPYSTPIQFTTFENIRITKGTTNEDTSYALHLEGENGQLTFINCQFDGGMGTSLSRGYNVYLEGSRGPENDDMLLPNVMSFVNCAFQNGDYGAYLKYAGSTTFDNCTFQSLGYGVVVDGSLEPNKAISILNSKFINVAGYGPLTPPTGYVKNNGACVKSSKSVINVSGNYFMSQGICSTCNFIEQVSDNYGLYVSGNSFSMPSLNKTLGIGTNIPQTSTTLNCRQQTFIGVISNGSYISNILSTINAGETITIKSTGASPLTFFKTSGTNGNITFPGGTTTFVLSTNEVATFKKTDLKGSSLSSSNTKNMYQLISVVRNNP